MDNNIKDFEKRLLDDRVKLDELLDEHYMNCSEEVKNKLKFLSQEMEYLEKQIEFIKKKDKEIVTESGKEGVILSASVTQAVNDNEEKNVNYESNVIPQVSEKAAAIVNEKTTAVPTNQTSVEPTMESKEDNKFSIAKNAKDLEQMVGKSLMGIFASILIFIGLIFGATLVVPYLNDAVKMCLMYVVSFAFLGAGLYLTHKDDNNKFYLALTGCGVGAVYISLIVSNVYFKVFGDILLYVLIAIWAIGVCVLSKYKNEIFQIIGLCGITIAMIFGCNLCIDNNDESKFLALVIFYIIASTVFYIAHFSKEFKKNIVNNVFNLVVVFYLYVSCVDITGGNMGLVKLLVLIIMLTHIGVALYCKIGDAKYSFGIYITLAMILLALQLHTVIHTEAVFSCVAWLFCAIVIAIIEVKSCENDIGPSIANGALTVIALYVLGAEPLLLHHGAVIMVILPLILLGYFRNKEIYKYISLIMSFIYIFGFDIEVLERLIFGVIILGTIYVFMFIKKDQYNMVFKYLCYILAMVFLLYVPAFTVKEYIGIEGLNNMISLLLTTGFNIFIMKSCFGNDLENGEVEDKRLFNIVNTIIMIAGLVNISAQYDLIIHFVIICVTLVAFMVNVENFLKKQDNLIGGIYVGFKFTLFMVVVLSSFDSPAYFISIGCFIASIISIVIGFMKKYKALRVYGLVLSMISIIKLIMVDITYDNNVGHVISFIASGLLCFCISMIYNFIDKKMKDENEE